MPTPPNATREQIIAALQEGRSVYRIVRDLHVDRARVRRIRDEAGIPTYVRPEETRTIEDKWRLYAKPVDGGHYEWTGERGMTSGTPLVSFKERHRSAAAVAFRIRTGRAPQGQAYADCGMKHCVAPDHVEDEQGRQRTREQLRFLRGGRARKQQCVNGHDQTRHGRYTPTGTAYCEACKRAPKTVEPTKETSP